MPLDHFFGELFGIVLLIISIAMLVRRRTFMALIDEVMASRGLMFVVALVSLIFGLIVVLTHNIWNGGLLSIVVTLFGWALVLRSILLLFLPQQDLRKIVKFIKPEQHYYILGFVALVLGAYLTYAGFWGMAM